MSVNGTNNNNFKVSSLGSDVPNDWAAQDTDATESVDDLFDMGPDGTGESYGSPDPLDDYTIGDMSGGAYAGAGATDNYDRLKNCVPVFEELLASNEKLINFLPLVMNRYSRLQDDLRKLKIQYEQSISSGTMTNDELQAINARLPLIDAALAGCKAQMDKVESSSSELDKIHLQEQRHMKDLNGDNIIGAYGQAGSLILQHNDDGTITYIDMISKKAVAAPIMDPDYEPQLVSNNSLQQIPQNESIADNSELEETDVFLQFNEACLKDSGNFADCPMGICIPVSFWCLRDPDGAGKPMIEFDDKLCEEKMALYGEWDTSSGFKQKIPEDLSKYIQVKVTGVKVRSVECGMTQDGDALYRHVVEFYNDQTVISRVSIEGAYTSSNNAVTSTTMNGEKYIAASTLGLAIEAPELAGPIEFDGSGYISTGRHVYKNLASDHGMSAPNEGEQSNMAYNENINAFASHDVITHDYSTGDADTSAGWVEVDHGLDDYGNLNDQFMGAAEDPTVGESPYTTFRTGLFINGLRGDITGSNYNDVIVCRGANEYTDYAKEHMPEDSMKIQQGDAFYNNFVSAGGGNDVVIAGRGNNYIDEATFVWLKDGGNRDENFVRVPDMPMSDTLNANSDIAPNQKTFVRVDGGTTQVYNPDEYRTQNDEDATNVKQAGASDPSYNDDWYVRESGSMKFGNPGDEDVLNSVGAGSSTYGFDANFFDQAKNEPNSSWYDELMAIPDPNDIDTDMVADVLASEGEMADEMNGFFDEMFGDMNSFMAEWEQEQLMG